MSLSLEEFQTIMKVESEKTRAVESVELEGVDLDDVLQQAALELSLPIRNIEYEILDKGRRGFLHIKAVPCRIIAYKSAKVEDISQSKAARVVNVFDAMPDDALIPLRFSVRLANSGAYVKIFPSDNELDPVRKEEVLGELETRYVVDVDRNALDKALKLADSQWIKVGEFDCIPECNAEASVEVSDNDMQAFVMLHPPEHGGADLSVQDIEGMLMTQGIIHGILPDAIQRIEDAPQYYMPILVAKGTEPQHGENARIEYTFETRADKIKFEAESDGSVNFRELHKFQNVRKGQTVAQKIEATKGVSGSNVFGVTIRPKNGVDTDFELGKNVERDSTGMRVIAQANGQVLLKSGKIFVETITVIPGNVDAKVGNINVFGSVQVRGNVEDGFSITAEGNIEVSGYVSRANLNAGGDISVSRGVNGGEGTEMGNLVAGKNIWASYIQNANCHAGEFVIVSSGIVNSHVVAQQKVLCKGKRAKIVGGHIQAAEEINAITFGSPGGVQTILEVGYDPVIKDEMDKIEADKLNLEEQKDKINASIKRMNHQIQTGNIRSSKEMKDRIQELRVRYTSIEERLTEIKEEKEMLEETLVSLSTNGQVSASSNVFSNVIVRIQDVEYLVREPYYSPVTFIRQTDTIKTIKYREIKENLDRDHLNEY